MRNILRDTERDTIWSGYNPLAKPILIHVNEKGSYIINPPKLPKGYTWLAGFSKPVCFGRDKGADRVISQYVTNYSAACGDVFFYNFSQGPVLQEAEETIIHEIFHLFQNAAFHGGTFSPKIQQQGKPGFFYAYKKNFNLVWNWSVDWIKSKRNPDSRSSSLKEFLAAGVEDKLLAMALLDKENYKGWLAKFIRMRDYRRDLLSQEQLANELSAERTEGTAYYAGLKTIADKSQSLAENYLAGQLLSPNILENNSNRAYAPPAAIGFLLDRAGIDWKKRVQNGEDVYAIAKEYFAPGADTPQVKALLRGMNAAGLEKILALKLELEQNEKKSALSALKNYDAWMLVINDRIDCESTFSYSGENIQTEQGNYIPGLISYQMLGKGFSLEVNHTGMIIRGSTRMVLLGKNSWTRLELDNKSAVVKSQTTRFESLNLETEHLLVTAQRAGQLKISGRTIMLDIFPEKSQE
jgi:hypothetical protein